MLLSAADYREIKSRYEPEIAQLGRKKKGIAQIDDNLLEYVSATADLLRNLPNYYKTASLPIKQKLIGSICSGKLIYEKNDYRTMEFNDEKRTKLQMETQTRCCLELLSIQLAKIFY
jgi:hypothetical protein